MRNITKRTLALVAAAAFLLVINAPLQASSGSSKEDNSIEKAAKKSYVFKNYLRGDGIKVQCTDGIVTLSGTVPENSHKSMAEETVRALPGVLSVNNQISVAPSHASPNSDAGLRERVRGTLLFHKSVNYSDTEVSVLDGTVTLRGKATSEAQKDLTTQYAREVSGIKRVDNQMVVTNARPKRDESAGDKIDDASITSQVKTSLLFHHGTDGFDTKVSTSKGIVTLTGTARSQTDKDRATARVTDIRGVKSVDNQMTVGALQSSTN